MHIICIFFCSLFFSLEPKTILYEAETRLSNPKATCNLATTQQMNNPSSGCFYLFKVNCLTAIESRINKSKINCYCTKNHWRKNVVCMLQLINSWQSVKMAVKLFIYMISLCTKNCKMLYRSWRWFIKTTTLRDTYSFVYLSGTEEISLWISNIDKNDLKLKMVKTVLENLLRSDILENNTKISNKHPSENSILSGILTALCFNT